MDYSNNPWFLPWAIWLGTASTKNTHEHLWSLPSDVPVKLVQEGICPKSMMFVIFPPFVFCILLGNKTDMTSLRGVIFVYQPISIWWVLLISTCVLFSPSGVTLLRLSFLYNPNTCYGQFNQELSIYQAQPQHLDTQGKLQR